VLHHSTPHYRAGFNLHVLLYTEIRTYKLCEIFGNISNFHLVVEGRDRINIKPNPNLLIQDLYTRFNHIQQKNDMHYVHTILTPAMVLALFPPREYINVSHFAELLHNIISTK